MILIFLDMILAFLVFYHALIVDSFSLGVAWSRKIIDVGETWAKEVSHKAPAFWDVRTRFVEKIVGGIALISWTFFDHPEYLSAVLRILVQNSSVSTGQNGAHFIDAEGFFGH
jgi:hypothetical protein